MFDPVLFIISLMVNVIILVLILKFRDLIRFGLMLRRVMKGKGYFNLTVDDLNDKISRIEAFMQPIMSPEKLSEEENGLKRKS